MRTAQPEVGQWGRAQASALCALGRLVLEHRKADVIASALAAAEEAIRADAECFDVGEALALAGMNTDGLQRLTRERILAREEALGRLTDLMVSAGRTCLETRDTDAVCAFWLTRGVGLALEPAGGQTGHLLMAARTALAEAAVITAPTHETGRVANHAAGVLRAADGASTTTQGDAA